MAEFLGAFWFLKLNSRRRVVLLPLSFEITFLGESPAPDSPAPVLGGGEGRPDLLRDW